MSTRLSLHKWLAPGLLLLWSFWLASECLVFGPSSYVRLHDAAEANTAYYTGLPEIARRHLIGFRDPLAGTGVDARTNLKGEMPLVEAIFRLAPHWSNAGVLLLAQTYVAGFGLYLLLRRMNTSRTAALVAAGWFAFVPGTYLEHAGFPTWYGWYVPGFPLVLLALDRAGRMRTGSGVCAAVGVGVLLALGSPTAYGTMALPAAAVWLLAFAPRSDWPRLAHRLAWLAVAFLIVKVPSIVALITTIPESHRAVRLQVPVTWTDTLKLADRMAGIRGLLVAHMPMPAVAFLGWASGGFRRRAVNRAFWAAVLVCAMTDLGPLLRPLQGLAGDFFRTYSPDRVSYFRPLVLAVAAALALDYLRDRAGDPSGRAAKFFRLGFTAATAGLVTGLIAASVWMNVARDAARTAGSNLQNFFQNPALQALARRQQSEDLFRVATLGDGLNTYSQHASFAWAYGLETADMYVTTYPMRYFEFWARVIAPVRARRQDLWLYFTTWGSRAFLFNPPASPGSPAADPRAPSPLPFNLNLLSLANVRFLLSEVPLRARELVLRDRSSGLLIYENLGVLPRFFVVHQWRAFSTPVDLLDALADSDSRTLSTTAFLDARDWRTISLSQSKQDSADTVRVVSYAADRVGLLTETRTEGILMMSQSYSPHWHASVDGVPAPILPVDHAFQGIRLAEGTHEVVVVYRPPHSSGGALQPVVIGAALLLCIVAANIASRRGAR